MKLYKMILLAAFALALASCRTVSKSSFAPDTTQLNIAMDDLVYLGEVEVSVDFDKYLGIFRRIEKINGVEYDGKKRQSASVSLNAFVGGVAINPVVCRALPKVYETYPETDYIIVVGQTVQREIMFLGSENVVKARVKAYKFKK